MQETIDSIQKQTFKNFEVCIVDGGSTKKTIQFLSTLQTPFFYQSEKDKGIYDAMNKGILLSKGEWLYFLGAGDLLEKNTVLSFVSSNLSKDADIVFGDAKYGEKKFYSNFSFKLFVKHTLHHQSVFYNSQLFVNCKYNTNLQVLADYEFNLKLFLQNVSFKKINIFVANCNHQGLSKQYNWPLYKEEISLKTNVTHVVFYPLFFFLGAFKFLYRKVFAGY